MKRLITFLILVAFATASYGQLLAPKGIKVGTGAGAQVAYNLTSTADYVIDKVGSTYYARPGIGTSYTAYSGALPSTVVQNAVTALTTGGHIFIKAGLYDNFDTVYITHDNITIEGDGMYKTILKLKANFDVGKGTNGTGMFILNGAKYTTFKNLQLDGNFANQTKKDDGDPAVMVAIINGIDGGRWDDANVQWYHPDFTTVENCFIKGFTQFGIYFMSCSNAIIRYNYLSDNAWNGVTIADECTFASVQNNYVTGGGDVGITLYGTDNVARYNIVKDISGSYGSTGSKAGISIESDVSHKAKRNKVIDNTITGWGMSYGIAVWSYSRNCMILGNTIDSISTGAAIGITLLLDSGSMVSNNKITNYGIGTTGHGIYLHGTSALKVFNNYVSTFRASTALLIEASGGVNSTNNIIHNNYLYNSAGYGINIGAGSTGNILSNNNIYGPWNEIEIATTTTGNIFKSNYGITTSRWLQETGLLNLGVTATADGLTTGLLASGSQNLTITSASANNIIALPSASASTIGTKITGIVGANGFELRVNAAQLTTVYLNGVTTNKEAAIPASVSFQITQIDATHWIVITWTALGAVGTAIVPDAV